MRQKTSQFIKLEDFIRDINAAASSITRTRLTARGHQVNLQKRIITLEKRKYELTRDFKKALASLDGEILRTKFIAGDRSKPSLPSRNQDTAVLQQATVCPRFIPLGSGLPSPNDDGAGIHERESSQLTPNIMYKKPFKTFEELKQEKKNLIEKIVNGSHLDSIGMASLQRALGEKEKAIIEHPDNPKNRKEVSHEI